MKKIRFIKALCGHNAKLRLDTLTGTLVIEVADPSQTGSVYFDVSYYTTKPFVKYWEQIETIIIKDGIQSIGEASFCKCSNLIEVILPESLTSIGHYSFSGCKSLYRINFPEGLTSIGNYAFQGCTNLRAVSFPNTLNSIGRQAFYNCRRLRVISSLSKTVEIGHQAFRGCGIEDLVDHFLTKR